MPSDLTVGQFVYVIRKRIKLSPEGVLARGAAQIVSLAWRHSLDGGDGAAVEGALAVEPRR